MATGCQIVFGCIYVLLVFFVNDFVSSGTAMKTGVIQGLTSINKSELKKNKKNIYFFFKFIPTSIYHVIGRPVVVVMVIHLTKIIYI